MSRATSDGECLVMTHQAFSLIIWVICSYGSLVYCCCLFGFWCSVWVSCLFGLLCSYGSLGHGSVISVNFNCQDTGYLLGARRALARRTFPSRARVRHRSQLRIRVPGIIWIGTAVLPGIVRVRLPIPRYAKMCVVFCACVLIMLSQRDHCWGTDQPPPPGLLSVGVLFSISDDDTR